MVQTKIKQILTQWIALQNEYRGKEQDIAYQIMCIHAIWTTRHEVLPHTGIKMTSENVVLK